MHPQLEEIKAQLDAASEKAIFIVKDLSPEQLTERPQPGKWSIAECLVHLNLSSEAEIEVLNEAYRRESRNRQTETGREFKMELFSRFLMWTLEPPPIALLKIKTTKDFQPGARREVEAPGEILPAFLALQEQLKKCADAAEGLPLDRIKVASPFIKKIKYNLLSCFHLLLAHERRHLWQAEKVKEALGRS